MARLDGSNATFEEIADRRSSIPSRHEVGTRSAKMANEIRKDVQTRFKKG
jgi:hypothetical protein